MCELLPFNLNVFVHIYTCTEADIILLMILFFANLQHPFVTGEYWESHAVGSSVMVRTFAVSYTSLNSYSFD